MDPCCVCLESFGSPPKGWMRLYCGHVYHPHCVEGLLDDACPMCRNPIRCKTFTVKVTVGEEAIKFTPFKDPVNIEGAQHCGRYARNIIQDFIGRGDARFEVWSEPGLIYSITSETPQPIINYFTLPTNATHRLKSKVANEVQNLHFENAHARGRLPLMTLFHMLAH